MKNENKKNIPWFGRLCAFAVACAVCASFCVLAFSIPRFLTFADYTTLPPYDEYPGITDEQLDEAYDALFGSIEKFPGTIYPNTSEFGCAIASAQILNYLDNLRDGVGFADNSRRYTVLSGCCKIVDYDGTESIVPGCISVSDHDISVSYSYPMSNLGGHLGFTFRGTSDYSVSSTSYDGNPAYNMFCSFLTNQSYITASVHCDSSHGWLNGGNYFELLDRFGYKINLTNIYKFTNSTQAYFSLANLNYHEITADSGYLSYSSNNAFPSGFGFISEHATFAGLDLSTSDYTTSTVSDIPITGDIATDLNTYQITYNNIYMTEIVNIVLNAIEPTEETSDTTESTDDTGFLPYEPFTLPDAWLETYTFPLETFPTIPFTDVEPPSVDVSKQNGISFWFVLAKKVFDSDSSGGLWDYFWIIFGLAVATVLIWKLGSHGGDKD